MIYGQFQSASYTDSFQASRPPRQATVPPRSGAGVGIGILRGFVFFGKSARFNSFFPKIPRFHARPKLFRKSWHCFQNRIYLCFEDLGISKIYQDSTIVKFFENAWRSQLCWIRKFDLPKRSRFHAEPTL